MTKYIERLEKLKLWAQIIATIAVPIIIVIIGNQVQQSIAEKELGKSYVQMAIEILKVPPSNETVDLRQWAVKTIDKLSPIPLSIKVQRQLESGKVELRPTGTGIVRYFECEPTKDKETAKWLLEKNPSEFHKCPKDDEVGLYKYKFKFNEGPLQGNETLETLKQNNDRMEEELTIADRSVQSVECSKVKDKETAKWLLNQYGKMFFKCQKDDEVGIRILKKADD